MMRPLRGGPSRGLPGGTPWLILWAFLPSARILAHQETKEAQIATYAPRGTLLPFRIPPSLGSPEEDGRAERPVERPFQAEENLPEDGSLWLGGTARLAGPLPRRMDLEDPGEMDFLAGPGEGGRSPLEGPLPDELRIAEAPQQDTSLNRSSRKPPWFEFRHLELVPFAGLTFFSSAFKADMDWHAGALVYLPVPVLPSGNYGIFGGVLIGNLDRKLNPSRSGEGGLYEMGLLGGYYTFYKNEGFFFRGGLGGAYVAYNGIPGLKDGPGGVVNVEFCLFNDQNKPASGFTFSPLLITDGQQFIFAMAFGVWIKF